jgi:hypothetical protein
MSLEDLKLRLVLFISQYLVNLYLEMMLNSNIASQCFHINASSSNGIPTAAHQDLLTRVNDDIQLIISSIEEFRAIMLPPQQSEDSTHYIQQAGSGSRDTERSASPAPSSSSAGKNVMGKMGGLLNKQRSVTSSNRETSPSLSSKTVSGSLSGSSGHLQSTGMSIFANLGNYHNKQLFDEIVLPLSHFSIILSMMMTYSASQYIIPFVQQELTQSFGIYSVNLWQLLCSWRGDKKEAITLEYNGSLRDWHMRKQNEFIRGGNNGDDDAEPRVDISFIAKVKAANVIKTM